MKIQTFSVLAGSAACNARCPFCISKMTPPLGVELKEPEVNWRNFRKACQLAKQAGTTTAMITSKGEPTLFPNQISKYLDAMQEHEFPIIELQTNGIPIAQNKEKYAPFLQDWYDKGLTTVAISIVHFEPEKNREIYLPYAKSYIDLPELVDRLHENKYTVRLACVMADGFIDSSGGLEDLIKFAKRNKVEQLTLRPVNKPEHSGSAETEQWVNQHYLKPEQLSEIRNYLSKNGKQLMTLQHGATVYDVNGQNVCITNSLTIDKSSEDLRQLIFFPDGHLRYDWQYEGAVLI